jgi:alpha-tubulin suppressor-like RCC1 family protein
VALRWSPGNDLVVHLDVVRVDADGTTTDRWPPVQIPGPTGVKAIAAGAYHSLAVKDDGTVWAWGWNAIGQLGDGTTVDRHQPVPVPGLTGVESISGGALHTVARLHDGTVRAWGWNGLGQLGTGGTADSAVPVPPTGLAGVNQVAAGLAQSFAVGPLTARRSRRPRRLRLVAQVGPSTCRSCPK